MPITIVEYFWFWNMDLKFGGLITKLTLPDPANPDSTFEGSFHEGSQHGGGGSGDGGGGISGKDHPHGHLSPTEFVESSGGFDFGSYGYCIVVISPLLGSRMSH